MQLLIDKHVYVKLVCLSEDWNVVHPFWQHLHVPSFPPPMSPSFSCPQEYSLPTLGIREGGNFVFGTPKLFWGLSALWGSHPPTLGTQRWYIFYLFRNFYSWKILIPWKKKVPGLREPVDWMVEGSPLCFWAWWGWHFCWRINWGFTATLWP